MFCHSPVSTLNVCARKRNLLLLRTTCSKVSRYKFLGNLAVDRDLSTKGEANQAWYVASLLGCSLGSFPSMALHVSWWWKRKPATNPLKGTDLPYKTANSNASPLRKPWKALISWAVQQPLSLARNAQSPLNTLRTVSLLLQSMLLYILMAALNQ
jgi:hypothetical protein